jgi:general stress protein YciG
MKKQLTISEFARLGGKARAQKLTKEQLSEIGRKGGRPRLDKKPKSTPNS